METRIENSKKENPYSISVFDIETAPLDEDTIRGMMPEFDITQVKLGNTTDPEKVKEKLRRAKLTHESKYVDKAALKAITGRVVAIGVLGTIGEEIHLCESGEEDERLALEWFWGQCDGISQMIGFNIFEFDLPFLVQRSWMLGVKVPRCVRQAGTRYWSRSFIDAMVEWSLGSYSNKYISLDMLGRALGVGEKTGSGKDFAELLAKDRDAAVKYLRNDLELTKKIATVMGLCDTPDIGR